MNLLTDIANIPYNEVQALNSVAGSLFFGGNWWVPSATNLWGVDTGDPTHVALVTNVFAPFPDFNQGLGGLQYQLDGLLAAELPVSDSCDAETCFPMTPAGSHHRQHVNRPGHRFPQRPHGPRQRGELRAVPELVQGAD